MFSSSGVKCEQLTQPASVTVHPGDRLTITCQTSYSLSSARTFWIRQPAGKELECIGSVHVGHSTRYKDSLQNKFSIDIDSSNRTVTLIGQNVQSEDSAVYYCAREPPTVTQSIMRPEQKPLSDWTHEATRGWSLRAPMISDQHNKKK